MSGGGLNQRKHWSIKAHESLIRRNAEGNFCLNIEGGAENGLMPHIGEIRQERIHYEKGKVLPGEILLEVNGKRVPGMIKKDVIALIKRSADPVSLVTVKQSELEGSGCVCVCVCVCVFVFVCERDSKWVGRSLSVFG